MSRRTNPHLLLPLVVRALAVAAGLWETASALAEPKTGDAFPDLAAAGVEGTVPTLAGHVAVVDFWASWCAPCKSSFPAYGRIQADFAARGVVVVGVSVDEKPASYAAFVKNHAPGFATVLDRSRRLVTAVQPPVMPTSYVLDRAGRVRFVHHGFHGSETDQTLRTQLELLLAEPSPTPAP